VAALKAQEVDLFRSTGLHWLPVDPGWVLPLGDAGTMVLVPAGDERSGETQTSHLQDLWHVYRAAKDRLPIRETAKPLSLEWARGVGDEIGRAYGGGVSRAGARWRSRPASDPQRRLITKHRLAGRKEAAGLTKGEAADLLTVEFAGREMSRLIRRNRVAA